MSTASHCESTVPVTDERQISDMSVAEKVKLALMGNKEARSLLIKDPNKIVATAVVKNTIWLHTTGVEWPNPGIRVFHRTFSFSLQRDGGHNGVDEDFVGGGVK